MMNPGKWFSKISLEKQSLYYKLYVISGLFFLAPIAGFMYFTMKYDILSDEYSPIYFITFLLFSLVGFIMLRKMFDEIVHISRNISHTVKEDLSLAQIPQAENELKNIVHSFQTLSRALRESFRQVEKKTAEISTLKEMTDFCNMTSDKESLLYITLERALKLAGADTGSVMMLEEPMRDVFVIVASIGLGDIVKKGDRVSFADSFAKHAVINKAPLLVADIETDIRLEHLSKPKYIAKSFVCMPLKTMHDVIGVLTISQRKTEEPFAQKDLDVLIPLLSNAAFAYDNLCLFKESTDRSTQLKTMENLSSMINSSFRGSELFHAMLSEIKNVVPYDIAIIMVRDEDIMQSLYIMDLLTFVPTNMNKGYSYLYEGTILDRLIKQQRTLVLDETTSLTHPVEKEIFSDHIANNVLLIPLKWGGRVTGILVLFNVQHESLTGKETLIENMASSLSLAIEKDKLLNNVARRNQELDALRQIGSALAASPFDMVKVMQHTMDMVQVIMDVDAGFLMLLDGNELEFKVAFSISTSIDTLKGIRFKLGEGIAGYSAARGESIMARNAKESKYFHPDFDRMTGFDTRSVLCVPLISQGKVLGVIEVLNKRHGEFTQSDLQLLQSIAATGSIAMENARLYGETLTMAEKERAFQ